MGRIIKKYILEKGLKQNIIAKNAKISAQTFNDMLNGRRKIEVEEYFKICESLQVSLNFFAEKMGYGNY